MLDLPPDEVHIWSAHQKSTLPPDVEATLSTDELDRAKRFCFPQHRLAYVFAHAVLRDVLSRYLHCSRDAIQFRHNAFGKPLLDNSDGGRALEFNITHAGGLVVVALCCGRRIGIDVEPIRVMDDISGISESYFTSKECSFVINQQGSERERAFWFCWTRKEAYVKAVGQGLSIPLNSFDTLISNRAPVVFLESPPESTDQVLWQLANVKLHRGYAAAVAIESGLNRLINFSWPDALQTNGAVEAP